jgi:hypothetical protein
MARALLRRRAMRNITFILLASLLFACGGSDGTTPIPAANTNTSENPPPGSSTPPDDGNEPADPNQPKDPAPTQPGACNTLVNDAKAISSIDVLASDAPVPAGGTIPSGTFHLAGITLYAGKSGKAATIPITLQGTVKVSGNAVEQVLDGKRPDGTTVAERSTESLATSGSDVTFTKTCDGTGSRTGKFTASATELTLFLVNDVGQTVGYVYR